MVRRPPAVYRLAILSWRPAAMFTTSADVRPSAQIAMAYELRYPCICNPERTLRFPCNAQGGVELDALSAVALDDYLYARVLVGREYGWPDVVPRKPT